MIGVDGNSCIKTSAKGAVKCGFIVSIILSCVGVSNLPRFEKTKETYYEPFVKYYLGIILKAYSEFEGRVEHLKNRSLSKPDRIKAVIDNKVGKITKKEIMELCPYLNHLPWSKHHR